MSAQASSESSPPRRQYVRPAALLLVTAISLYLLLPSLVAVFSSWHSLSNLDEDVLRVGRVRLDEREPQLILEHCHPLLELCNDPVAREFIGGDAAFLGHPGEQPRILGG